MSLASRTSVKVLQVGPLMPALEKKLADDYRAVRLPEDGARRSFLDTSGAEFGVAVTSGKYGVSRDVMDGLSNLKAVVNFGVGYDGTDTDTAAQRSIGVSNTPDVLTECVADTAVAQLLNVCRHFPAADRFVRSGAWAKDPFPLTRKVSGQHVGIVGFGRIGQAAARRLVGFGCAISYHSRTPIKGKSHRYVRDLETLARECDSLIVTVAGGATTTGLISAPVLKALGPRGYLVNVSRGSVIDEDALIAALRSGAIAGAALDVFRDEPHVRTELMKFTNVVLSPHVGSGTVETRVAMIDLVIANLDRFLAEGRLLTPIA